MALKHYDADQVSLIVAGIPISGFADGEFLTLEMASDMFSDVVGTDGEVTRSKSNDRRATCTIKLMQSSDSNDLLSALANTDSAAPNGAGVGAFMLKDRNGRMLHAAAACWVQREPDMSLDRAATSREWVIRIASLKRFDGGN
jgi:hypothetical protein